MADSERAAMEARMKEIMMDNLGIERVENLPMQDVPRDLPVRHAHNGYGGRPSAQRQFRVVAINPEWQKAIASGKFDDEDAAAVKGLDDLGGGRLHALRAQNGGGGPMPLGLEKRSSTALYYQRQGLEMPPNRTLSARKQGTSPLGIVLDDRPVRTFSPRYTPGPAPPRNGAPNQSAANRIQPTNGPSNGNTLAPRPSSLRTSSGPVWKPTAFEVTVKYLSGPQIWVWGKAYLSHPTGPQASGSFTLIVDDKKVCVLGLDSWLDHEARKNQLRLLFIDSSSKKTTYCLLFRDEEILKDFLSNAKKLQKNKPTLPAGADPAPPAASGVAPREAQAPQPAPDDQAATSAQPAPLINISSHERQCLNEAISSHIRQDEGILIELDDSEYIELPDPRGEESSSLQLLKTLAIVQSEPQFYEATNGNDATDQLTGSDMSEYLGNLANSLATLFRPTLVRGQADEQLANAMKQTLVAKHRMLAEKGAFFPTLPEGEREKAFENFLAMPLEPLPAKAGNTELRPPHQGGRRIPADEASDSDESEDNGPRRIEYTDKELLGLRRFATSPPARLFQLPFLPPHYGKKPKGPTPAKEKPAPPRPANKAVPAKTGSHDAHMEREMSSQPVKKPESPAKAPRGLASSRWAAEMPSFGEKRSTCSSYEHRKDDNQSSDFTLITY